MDIVCRPTTFTNNINGHFRSAMFWVRRRSVQQAAQLIGADRHQPVEQVQRTAFVSNTPGVISLHMQGVRPATAAVVRETTDSSVNIQKHLENSPEWRRLCGGMQQVVYYYYYCMLDNDIECFINLPCDFRIRWHFLWLKMFCVVFDSLSALRGDVRSAKNHLERFNSCANRRKTALHAKNY